MKSHTPEPSEKSEWKSVHKCPKCGHELSLAKLNLYETTTGIVTCPKCKWSGQVDLRIVPRTESVG
jgi:ssDNA-binding Zn-finger/Zn-ribbon topoisomerase 1